jgi:hypothetical protein
MTSKKTSEKKAAANRANAKKSSGPKTPRGKSKSRNNSLKDGFFATSVLPGEDSAAYQELHQSLISQYHPEGAEELMLVHQICRALWWLRRSQQIENAKLSRVAYMEAELAESRANPGAEKKVSDTGRPEVYEEDVIAVLGDLVGSSQFETFERHIEGFLDRIERYRDRLESLQVERLSD